VQGPQGEPGNSGVYIGNDEPEDANVWFDINAEGDEYPTTAQIQKMIDDAIAALEDRIMKKLDNSSET
jgi:hypothetical protein